jgi:hypothetical protein
MYQNLQEAVSSDIWYCNVPSAHVAAGSLHKEILHQLAAVAVWLVRQTAFARSHFRPPQMAGAKSNKGHSPGEGEASYITILYMLLYDDISYVCYELAIQPMS